MMKTDSQPVFKLRYFECKKGSYHDGQVLNYICIQKSCQSKGLICSVCKNDHTNHNVIPLKYLLSILKTHQQQPMQSESFQDELQQLQDLKNSFLYQLKTVIQKFARQIQQIQEEIMENYKQKKLQLMNQIEMNMKFNEIIHQTLENNIDNQESFQKDFKIIASLVQNHAKDEKNGNKNLSFSINLNNIIKDYTSRYKAFSNKINKYFSDSENVITDLLKYKQQSIPQLSSINNPFLNSQFLTYKFSTEFKGKNMGLSNNNKTASCMATGQERFALIQGPPIQKSGTVIRFKIQKIENWIGLGIAIKSSISAKNYHFLYNTIGHGSFLISHNGYSWSHSFAPNNLQTTPFSFLEGNIIKIEVKQKELIYTNQTQLNKIYKLPIELTEDQWKDVCFCANLCSSGDSATILG